ncbi:MAG: hypothetical protein QN120_06295 [Armatimonadota bacterium]|nr:hypothetical protein [Armatimonadota bacterium]
MISDSPYSTRGVILPLWIGAVAGIAAAILMLVVISVLRPDTSSDLGWLLTNSLLGARHAPAAWPAWAWLCVHLAAGAIGGILHAASQLRAPTAAVLVTGVFYAVLVWVVSRFAIGSVIGPPLRDLMHSAAWLGACLAYGLVLAGLAAVWQVRHPLAEGVQSAKD